MIPATTHPTTREFLRMTTVAIGVALAALATLAAVLQASVEAVAPDHRASPVAREELRLEAARASAGARPLIGDSHLPHFDARAAIAREEAVLRQLSSTRTATR